MIIGNPNYVVGCDVKKLNFKSQLKVLEENKFYRFGDLIFKDGGGRWESDREVIKNNDDFNDTILCKYLLQVNDLAGPDFELLKKIIHEHTIEHKCKIPEENELVIHLRLGDIFQKSKYEKLRVKRLKKSVDRLFRKDNILNSNPEMIKKITIVTALHYGANEVNGKHFYTKHSYNQNLSFLSNFEERINARGFELNLISNENTDLDLCYMANSKYFVKGCSNFSHIIAKCMSDDAQIMNYTYR